MLNGLFHLVSSTTNVNFPVLGTCYGPVCRSSPRSRQTMRWSLVCVCPQSLVSGSLDEPHFHRLTLDLPTFVRRWFKDLKVDQPFPPLGRHSAYHCTFWLAWWVFQVMCATFPIVWPWIFLSNSIANRKNSVISGPPLAMYWVVWDGKRVHVTAHVRLSQSAYPAEHLPRQHVEWEK